MTKQPVILNIYDMYTKNKYLEIVKVGVYHSGIEVYSSEYSYLGGPYDDSGIIKTKPKCEQLPGFDVFKFKKAVIIGYTEYSDQFVLRLSELMGQKFKSNEYHLFRKNCNHFTDAFAKLLCGKGIPFWVNRAALVCHYVPLLELCLPKELLTPVIVKKRIQNTIV